MNNDPVNLIDPEGQQSVSGAIFVVTCVGVFVAALIQNEINKVNREISRQCTASGGKYLPPSGAFKLGGCNCAQASPGSDCNP